jgi:hypothetical protein
LNPAREEGGCAVGGRDTTERNGFWLACGPIHYREEVGETRRLRKGAHQIHMHVFKTAVRNGDDCRGEMYVAGNL